MKTPVHSRRRFVKTAALAAASVPWITRFASSARAAEGERKIGFALCGLGSLSAGQLAPALQRTKYCRLTGIITGHPAKAERWKARYNIPDKNIYNYDTMVQLADNPDIDVVYVVTPNALHAESTIKAAKAGKHVLCEKPMEASVEKCQAMIDACKAANRLLAIGYRCHFEPLHIECMRLAREKVYGDVKMIQAGFGFAMDNPSQWRLNRALAGGGCLMDVGIYALQTARYITGEEPILVSGMDTTTDHVMFKEVEESMQFQLKFPSGIIANCQTTYKFDGLNQFTVYAERGIFGLHPAYNYNGNRGTKSGFGFGGGRGEAISADHEVDQFAEEMDDFAQCILKNTPSKVSGEEGLRDLKIMTAIYESIKTGAAVKMA